MVIFVCFTCLDIILKLPPPFLVGTLEQIVQGWGLYNIIARWQSSWNCNQPATQIRIYLDIIRFHVFIIDIGMQLAQQHHTISCSFLIRGCTRNSTKAIHINYDHPSHPSSSTVWATLFPFNQATPSRTAKSNAWQHSRCNFTLRQPSSEKKRKVALEDHVHGLYDDNEKADIGAKG